MRSDASRVHEPSVPTRLCPCERRGATVPAVHVRLGLAALVALPFIPACSSGTGFEETLTGLTQTTTASAGSTEVTSGTHAPTTTGDTPTTTATASSTDPGTTTSEDTTTGEPGLPTGSIEIGFWCGLPTAELTPARFAEISAAGFTFVANACDGATYVPAHNLLMLSLAHDAGLTAVLTDARALAAAAGTDVEANLDAVVADYKDAPGLRGYHLYDEPNADQFPKLAAAVAGLAARDPDHPGIINLLPDYASAAQFGLPTYDEYIAAFLAQVMPVDFSYDHYNFLADNTDGPSFFANLAVVRAHALAAAVPFGQYIQAIRYNGHRDTTGPEKRWAALHTLAYGGRTVMYFTYWTPPQTMENFGDGIIGADGKPTTQYADVAAINQSLRSMGKYLGAATSTGVFHNGPLMPATAPRSPGAPVYLPSPAPITVGMFAVGDDAYALLINRDHVAPTESDVILASAAEPRELDVASGEFIAIPGATPEGTDTRFHITLPPGDGLLFHLPGPLPPGPPGAEAFVGTVRKDAGSLDIVDATFGAQRLRDAGWDDCPAGTQLLAHDFQSDGFWLCARTDLAAHTFHIGNVVGDAGELSRVENGTVTKLGPAGWDMCPTGKLLGHRFDSNGFWLCMDP